MAGCAGLSRGAEGGCRQTGLLDLSLIQTDKYEEALRQGDQQACGPARIRKEILDERRPEWDEITDRIGVDKQKAVYEAWAAKPGAYPK